MTAAEEKTNTEKICRTPEETFSFGEELGNALSGGEVIYLHGGLGAGKTLLTKGILSGLGYDVDEVSSPSFTLVNLYETDRFAVYHIDLWRLENGAADVVGLEEILENEDAVVIIEWAEKLGSFSPRRQVLDISISGDGDDPRTVTIRTEKS
ncbi:MAG: tRNA (adenosine(37)-N6)-threonylcarbamoyltransferase complex ATPase subunit type 1 TsaE [Acidobacteriota bacterium]|nr:MAG: tRNA (adenosine(37)-N6)-threonylcarbamoyltransferase complex ATPase subunit type 1 TsaE [Acidobacteriota bacterium]